jgi:hypothetical protein
MLSWRYFPRTVRTGHGKVKQAAIGVGTRSRVLPCGGDTHYVSLVDAPLGVDPAPAGPFVEALLGLAGALVEEAALLVQEVRRQHLHVAREGGQSDRVEAREMSLVLHRERGGDVHSRIARGVVVDVHKQILESHASPPTGASSGPRPSLRLHVPGLQPFGFTWPWHHDCSVFAEDSRVTRTILVVDTPSVAGQARNRA